MELATRLDGCEARGDLLCVEASRCSDAVATGSEEGTLTVFDARSWAMSARVRDAGGAGDAVTSVAFHLANEHALYAAAGTSVLEFDLRKASGGCGGGADACVRRYTHSAEEVNHLAVSPRGDALAAADDSGCVAVVCLRTHALLRTLRRQHTNIASAAAWRPNRTAELLSAGLDARVVEWDARLGRAKRSWGMSDVLAEVEARESGAAAPAAAGERTQMCNPPFAHAVAVGEKDAAGAQRFAAVACGDGSVALLLLDAPPARGARTAWALGRAAGGHTACASHAAFPAFAAGAPLLLSAANDGRALLWNWGAYVAGDDAAPRVVAAAAHGAKINWAAAAAAPVPRVYLADTSHTLAVYDVRLG